MDNALSLLKEVCMHFSCGKNNMNLIVVLPIKRGAKLCEEAETFSKHQKDRLHIPSWKEDLCS